MLSILALSTWVKADQTGRICSKVTHITLANVTDDRNKTLTLNERRTAVTLVGIYIKQSLSLVISAPNGDGFSLHLILSAEGGIFASPLLSERRLDAWVAQRALIGCLHCSASADWLPVSWRHIQDQNIRAGYVWLKFMLLKVFLRPNAHYFDQIHHEIWSQQCYNPCLWSKSKTIKAETG